MSNRLTITVLQWLDDHAPLIDEQRSTAVALLLVLVEHADDNGTTPTRRAFDRAYFARKIGCDTRTITRAMAALVRAGAVVRTSTGGPRAGLFSEQYCIVVRGPRLETPSTAVEVISVPLAGAISSGVDVGRKPPVDHTPIDGRASLPGLAPDPAPTKPVSMGSRVVRKMYARLEQAGLPAPTATFVSLVQLAQRFVDAGHKPQAVLNAMADPDCIHTRAGIELQLKRAGNPRNGAAAVKSATAATNHEGKTRVVTPEEIRARRTNR